jgi:hypothetical protein
MRSLLTRLKRLEHARAAERLPQFEVQIGYLKELPPEYVGERHIVTVGRLADGEYHWEERPGPGPTPANEDDDDARTIIRINLVAPKEMGWPAPNAKESAQ